MLFDLSLRKRSQTKHISKKKNLKTLQTVEIGRKVRLSLVTNWRTPWCLIKKKLMWFVACWDKHASPYLPSTPSIHPPHKCCKAELIFWQGQFGVTFRWKFPVNFVSMVDNLLRLISQFPFVVQTLSVRFPMLRISLGASVYFCIYIW